MDMAAHGLARKLVREFDETKPVTCGGVCLKLCVIPTLVFLAQFAVIQAAMWGGDIVLPMADDATDYSPDFNWSTNFGTWGCDGNVFERKMCACASECPCGHGSRDETHAEFRDRCTCACVESKGCCFKSSALASAAYLQDVAHTDAHMYIGMVALATYLFLWAFESCRHAQRCGCMQRCEEYLEANTETSGGSLSNFWLSTLGVGESLLVDGLEAKIQNGAIYSDPYITKCQAVCCCGAPCFGCCYSEEKLAEMHELNTVIRQLNLHKPVRKMLMKQIADEMEVSDVNAFQMEVGDGLPMINPFSAESRQMGTEFGERFNEEAGVSTLGLEHFKRVSGPGAWTLDVVSMIVVIPLLVICLANPNLVGRRYPYFGRASGKSARLWAMENFCGILESSGILNACFLRRFLWGCDANSGMFSQSLACTMLFSGDSWSFFGILAWIVVQLFFWFYFFHNHKQTRSAEKKEGKFKIAKAVGTLVYDLALVGIALGGTSAIAMVVAPLKVITAFVKVHQTIDDTHTQAMYIDVPTAWMESIFLMAVNPGWWTTVFIEQPLHWISAPGWSKRGINTFFSVRDKVGTAQDLLDASDF